jgi:hypothetical protein
MNFWSLFAGLLIIMIGISIMLRVFGVNFPIFRILIALFIIFVGVRLPNGNFAAFGTAYYNTDSHKEGQLCVNIDVNSVFGGIEIR